MLAQRDSTVSFTDLDQGREILSRFSLPKSMKHSVLSGSRDKFALWATHKNSAPQSIRFKFSVPHFAKRKILKEIVCLFV